MESQIEKVLHQNQTDKRHHLKTKEKDGSTLYTNPWPTWGFPSKLDQLSLSWEFLRSPVPPSSSELDKTLPIDEINWQIVNNPDPRILQSTWIGHATFLVQFSGLNILTDPVFSERCSFSQWVGPKRYRRTPCTIKELPKIDVVVLSHNHYDHLDYASIQDLQEYHKPTYYVPLGKKEWFTSSFPESIVYELDWWESIRHPNSDLTLTFLPVQHWSGRGIHDRLQTLWGGWALRFPLNKVEEKEEEEVRVFFAGDTGYCPSFKEIGNVFKTFDLGLIPIGAYEPRWFMKYSHINPDEAVQIALDIGAKRSIGMHWGTFVLTTEPILEPRELLLTSLEQRKLPSDFFVTVNHGQTDVIKLDYEIKAQDQNQSEPNSEPNSEQQ